MSKQKEQTDNEKPGTDLYKVLHSHAEPGTRLDILKQNAELLQHSPIEWLQHTAQEFSGLATDLEYAKPNYIEDVFEFCKEKYPGISTIKAYEHVTVLTETVWENYILYPSLLIEEIELFRENILKAFENTAIFSNLLNGIGILEYVIRMAKDYEEMFSCAQYYHSKYYPEQYSQFSESEAQNDKDSIKNFYGEGAVKKYERYTKLTINDYEYSFKYIKLLIEEIKNARYAEKLRDLSFAISGYCNLKSENYADIEAQIAKRYEIAYQSFQYAEVKTGENLTDRQAYDYLKGHGVENIEGFELQDDFYTWQRYVRGGRRHHGTPKNTLRAGRACRSAVKSDDIDVRQITSQLNNSTDTD
jgi:hypothetical protein